MRKVRLSLRPVGLSEVAPFAGLLWWVRGYREYLPADGAVFSLGYYARSRALLSLTAEMVCIAPVILAVLSMDSICFCMSWRDNLSPPPLPLHPLPQPQSRPC